MAPLIADVVDLLALVCGSGVIVLGSLLFGIVLIRQLRWFGYDGLRKADDD